MHILYMVQYVNSPDDPGGSRAYEFAGHWAASGHRVTMLAGNLNHKTLSTITSATVPPPGVTVVRVPTYNRIRGSYARRIVNFLSYAAGATLRVLTIRRVDVVYASSTPLTTGAAGWLAAFLKRARFVFEVRDLWPESAIVAGVLRRGSLVRLIEAVERFLYARADALVALSEGIRAGIVNRGGAPAKVALVPNGTDDWTIDRPIRPTATFPLDTDRYFVCTYVGALGRWNSLETLLDAARLLEGSRVRFLIVGDGDHRDALRKRAEALGLTNVVFHGAIPKKQVLEYLAASHLCVLCTWRDPFLGTVLQNKIFDYMASGRPVAAAAQGELATLVETADCGWVTTPEAPEELARLCLELSTADPQMLVRPGANGRAFVDRHYRRSRLADDALDAMAAPGCHRDADEHPSAAQA
jgi:glycosyltransferase involved in cell wall biosynthesis